MNITVYEHKGYNVAEIDETLHKNLMKYWDDTYEEFRNDIEIPVKDVYRYLCHIEKDNTWDAIYVMENSNGSISLFGEEFLHKEYALKWLTDEYYDTDELKNKDVRNNPLLDEVERLRELVKGCVEHISEFEDDDNTTAKVLLDIGFFDTEIDQYGLTQHN